jgi:hypothetical protein
MNIFEKFWNLLTGTPSRSRRRRASRGPSTPSGSLDHWELEELRNLEPLTLDELNTWIRNCTDAALANEITEAATEMARGGHNYRRFATIVYSLVTRNPDAPISEHITVAKQIVAPLATRFAGYDQPQWTEAELVEWVDSLDRYRDSVEDKIRQYLNRGGTDLRGLLCRIRVKVEGFKADEAREREARETKEAEEAASNGVSPLHVWYTWQEEKRKIAQQEYFTRENRKARGW